MRRSLFTLSLIGAGLGLSGCSQDAELAACRSELAVAVATSKTAQDRVTALEQQLAASTERLTQLAADRLAADSAAPAPTKPHPTSAPRAANAPATAPAPSPAPSPSQPPPAPLSPEQRRTQKF